MMEVTDFQLGVDGGRTERCLFCAVTVPPSFMVVNGNITRLKNERADDHDDDGCIPSTLSSSNLTTEGSCLDKQLKVIFILKNILHFPEKKLGGFLEQFGGQLHPEFWCQVCSTCGEAVQQFYETLKEISGLKRRLTRISNELKCQIHNTKEVGRGGEGLTSIWEEVRAEVLKDWAPFEVKKEAKTKKDCQEDEEQDQIFTSVVNPLSPSPEIRSPDRLSPESVSEASEEGEEDNHIHSDFEPEDDNEDGNNSSESDSSEDDDYQLPNRNRVLKRKITTNAAPNSPIKPKRGRPPNRRPTSRLRKSPQRKKKDCKSSDSSGQPLYTTFQKGHHKWHKCSLCSAEKRDKKLILNHLRLHETGEGSTCSQCGWLVVPGGMSRHAAFYHTERKPRPLDKKTYFHICHKCPARFLGKGYLKEHLKLHDESNLEDTTVCESCGWLLKNKYIRRHMTKHHHGKGKEKQDEMNKRAEISQTMDIPYYCICQMIYTTKNHLQQHFAKHHADKEGFLACSQQPDCQEKFETKQLLNIHLKMDHPDLQIQEESLIEEGNQSCPHCELVCSSKYKVDYHIAKKHRDILLTCATCNIVHKSYKGFCKHMDTRAHATSQSFFCELCPKSFFVEDRLKHHRRHQHFQELGLEPNACKICGKILSDQRTLNDHIKAIHAKERNFSCEYCGKTFSKPHQLRNHINAFHEGRLGNTAVPEGRHYRLEKKGEDGVEIWLCEFCPATFPNLQSVRTHLLSAVHYEQLKHICEGCNKRFCASMGLHKHRKYCQKLKKEGESDETPAKKYNCEFCPKTFDSYESRYKHQRKTHKSCYTHVCKKCGNVYVSFANLEQHQKTCSPLSETVSTGPAE